MNGNPASAEEPVGNREGKSRVPSRHGRLAPSLREVTKVIVRLMNMPSTREWIDSLAAEFGVAEPTDEEIESLLALAGSAAHAAERTAAPLSCWLVGIAGVAPAEARVAVERLAARLQLPAN
jgi:hypothetical protein